MKVAVKPCREAGELRQLLALIYSPGEIVWKSIDLTKNGLKQSFSFGKVKFLTKTEQKKCKNSNIFLIECYLLFEEYLQGKNFCLYPNPCQGVSQSFEESLLLLS